MLKQRRFIKISRVGQTVLLYLLILCLVVPHNILAEWSQPKVNPTVNQAMEQTSDLISIHRFWDRPHIPINETALMNIHIDSWLDGHSDGSNQSIDHSIVFLVKDIVGYRMLIDVIDSSPSFYEKLEIGIISLIGSPQIVSPFTTDFNYAKDLAYQSYMAALGLPNHSDDVSDDYSLAESMLQHASGNHHYRVVLSGELNQDSKNADLSVIQAVYEHEVGNVLPNDGNRQMLHFQDTVKLKQWLQNIMPNGNLQNQRGLLS